MAFDSVEPQDSAPRNRRRPGMLRFLLSRSATVLAVAVCCLGLMSALLVASALSRSEDRDERATFESSAALLSLQLTSEVARYVDAATSLAASLGAHDVLHAADFDSVTSPLNAGQLNGIESAAYVVTTDTAGIASSQAYWRAQGAPSNLTFVPWTDANTHYFSAYTRSLHADIVSTSRVVDLARYPEVVAALESAKSTGVITISRALASHRDNPLFPQDQEPTFVLVAPAYSSAPAGESRRFNGWVALGLRAQDIANRAFAKSDVRSFENVRVSGVNANNEPVLVSALHAKHSSDSMRSSRSIVIAQDLWRLDVFANPSRPFFDGARPQLSAFVLACGFIASLLLGALVYVLAGSRARALELVAARTADLERDIERRERVERDLKAAQAESEEQQADLSAFAGFAAHDLKAPLTVLTGYLELIKTGITNPSTVKAGELPEFSDRAIRASRRMRSLVDSLLAFARARETRLAPAPVALEPALREVVDLLLEQRQAEGEQQPTPIITLHPPFPAVHMDPEMLRQVLENLIGNALKYVEAGTPANVDVRAVELGQEMVELVVADRGIGIPRDRREAVFGGFVRAHTQGYSGSGLGLAICKRVVERHGGSIRVEENPGGGTRFIVQLPRSGNQEGNESFP
jgi:signal transduction histidine kinase